MACLLLLWLSCWRPGVLADACSLLLPAIQTRHAFSDIPILLLISLLLQVSQLIMVTLLLLVSLQELTSLVLLVYLLLVSLQLVVSLILMTPLLSACLTFCLGMHVCNCAACQ